MGDDWDPFADPADDTPAPAAAPGGGQEPGRAGHPPEADPDDILAILHEPPKERRKWTYDDFLPLLDRLFAIPDSDTKALEAAFKPVAEALKDDGEVAWVVWRRAFPILEEFNRKDGERRPNLLGLLVDDQLGVYKNESLDMNEIGIHAPEEQGGCPPSGVVVFVFAWGGGTMRDLDDVHAFYAELFPGALIAKLTCNMKASVGLRKECAYAIMAAAATWGRLPDGAPRKLLVHMFSNGGFMTWTEMLQMWEDLSSRDEPHPTLGHPLPPMKEVLRGLILDSCCDTDIRIEPCVVSLVQGFAGFLCSAVATDHDGSEAGMRAADIKGKKAIQLLISHNSPVRAHLMKKPERLLTRKSNVDAKIVHELEPPVHMQFIYSKDDNVIGHSAVEDYIEQVLRRPSRSSFAAPRKLCFERSRHCLHKQVHREEYWSCVKHFATSTVMPD